MTGGGKVEVIDLKGREVFSHEGRGVAALVEEPHLKIRQIGLEPSTEVPMHTADAPVTLQVMRGEGLFCAGARSIRMGPGKLLRIPQGVLMGIRNDSDSQLVFLVIKTPQAAEPSRDAAVPADRPSPSAEPAPAAAEPASEPAQEAVQASKAGTFVNLIEFAPLKPGREEALKEWFQRSSEILARQPGFVSRTLLGPIEGGSRYAAVFEHESKDTFMDMQLSDEREELSRQAESLLLGPSTPHFYETLLSYRK
jgi:quercetin dioxygenase-like cupin family protein/heme-degrading monooxygenase HmoA